MLVYFPEAVCVASEWLLMPHKPHFRGWCCCGFVHFKRENRLRQNLEYDSLRGKDASGDIGESCVVSDLR